MSSLVKTSSPCGGGKYNGTIKDAAGNPLAAGFTPGQAYTITKKYKANLKSIGVQDGWVLELSEKTNKGGSLNKTSPTLRLGDNFQKKQYRSILSFNTKGLHDKAVYHPFQNLWSLQAPAG